MSQRDTQFAGFAARLLQEMLDQGAYVAIADWATGGDRARTGQLIARRAYDLVEHTLSIVPHLLQVVGDAKDLDVVMPYVPDLPTLPEEPAHDADRAR